MSCEGILWLSQGNLPNRPQAAAISSTFLLPFGQIVQKGLSNPGVLGDSERRKSRKKRPAAAYLPTMPGGRNSGRIAHSTNRVPEERCYANFRTYCAEASGIS